VKDVQGTFGTVTLQWSDKKFWGDLPLDAGYVHKLAIKRSYGGKRLGLRLLAWAEAKLERKARGTCG
jgi:hypothetical protein